MNNLKISIGIDISKHFLDVCTLPHRSLKRFENTPQGIIKLIRHIKPYQESLWRIVFEPSGGYEQPLLQTLCADHWPVSMVHARYIRSFAKSQKDLAKTDAIDAYVLAWYGLTIEPELTTLKTQAQQMLSEWTRRRAALQGQLGSEKRRLDKKPSPDIEQSINRQIAFLNGEIAHAEERITAILRADFPAEDALLRDVRGVGTQTIATLLGDMPEIGTTKSQYIVRLAGLAPMNHESGSCVGKRFIRGGRQHIRNVLYMATVAAIRCNVHIREFYDRLKAKGKPTKLAITACMRKLLRILNGRMMRFYKAEQIF